MAAIDALPEPIAGEIERFLDGLWAERGLSDATLAAYRNDLARLAGWLVAQGHHSLLAAGRGDLQAYLAARNTPGSNPRSAARLLSSLRQFYRYQRAGAIDTDPTALIPSPARGRLPATLTEADVEALLAAPATDTDLGLRDRAMLERCMPPACACPSWSGRAARGSICARA